MPRTLVFLALLGAALVDCGHAGAPVRGNLRATSPATATAGSQITISVAGLDPVGSPAVAKHR
jgi:hypothetical protein